MHGNVLDRPPGSNTFNRPQRPLLKAMSLVSFCVLFGLLFQTVRLTGETVQAHDDGATIPPQFAAWGTTGGQMKPLPEGWTEVPPEETPGGFEATELESNKGFVLFARHPLELVYSSTTPSDLEKIDSLRMLASPGTYESASFALHALKNLREVEVSAGNLKARDTDEQISAANIDVRVVRSLPHAVNRDARQYRMHPYLLESLDSADVSSGTTRQWWLTVHVPENARPGVYASEISINADGEIYPLGLLMNVLPITLVDPPVRVSVFGNRFGSTPEVNQKGWIDQIEHGMTGISVSFDGFDLDSAKQRLERALSTFGCVESASKRVNLNAWLRTISNWNHAANWFVYYPFSEELDAQYVSFVNTLVDWCRDAGFEPVVYPADEPAAHPDTIEAARHYYALLKRELPDVKTGLTGGGGWAMGTPEEQIFEGLVDVWRMNRYYPDKVATLLERGHEFGIYNMSGGGLKGGTQHVSNRVGYGFLPWRLNASSTAQWVYAWGNVLDFYVTSPGANYCYVFPPENPDDGPIPTIEWEAVRAGVNDLKYIYTLKDAITRAGSNEKAKEAQAFLEEIRGQIATTGTCHLRDGGTVATLAPSAYDIWRWRIASLIIELNK